MRVLLEVNPRLLNFVVIPGQRVAWSTRNGTVQVFDATAVSTGGPLTLVVELSKEMVGLVGDWRITDPIKYGDGLIVIARSEREDQPPKAYSWRVGEGALELPPLELLFHQIKLADPDQGLVLEDVSLSRAVQRDGSWMISPPFGNYEQTRIPLAFAGSDMLVSLFRAAEELGTGGQAGGHNEPTFAVERWSANGELIASYAALELPGTAVPVDGGWLFAERDVRGSSDPAFEWLAPGAQALKKVTDVRRISAGDAEDGFFGVTANGHTVYLANCQDGLLYGQIRQRSAFLLRAVKRGIAECEPTSAPELGDLVLLRQRARESPLEFAVLCDE